MGNDISVLRGQSYSREFTIAKEDGTAFDLTGQTVNFRLFDELPDTPLLSYTSAANPTKVVIVGAATAGKVRIDLAPSDTDRAAAPYVYVLFAVDGAGKKTPFVWPTTFYVSEGGLT